MFEGYGVGLAVRPRGLDAAPSVGPPGVEVRPSRLTEVLPVAAWSAVEQATELQRIQVLKGVLAAYEASVVMAFAAHSAGTLDPQPGEAGRGVNSGSPIPGTSEFFVSELASVINASDRSAGILATHSYVLVERLPCVWAALADGELDWPRARVFVDVLGAAAAGVAETVAPQVLPEATELSLGRLRARLNRAVLEADPTAADGRREHAERSADVRLYPTGDGMSELAMEMPAPLGAACWSTVDELARMAKNAGDGRPIGQLRAAVAADLMLRPWDTSRPAVTAHLNVVATLPSLRRSATGAAPGEVNGQPVTAAHVRELLEQLDAVCPGGLQAPTGGSLQIAVTDDDGALLATVSRPELERIARRGCPEHPGPAAAPPAAPRDACDCAVLTKPPAVDRYTPSPAQRRFGKTRDRTCRHPNCGQPVGRVDLDHVIPYGAGGPTDCDNLCCLCRRHHRLKTHAAGWRFVLLPNGVLRVTTPSGVTRTTRPPGLRERIDHDQRALPAPPPPPPESDDPPPF